MRSGCTACQRRHNADQRQAWVATRPSPRGRRQKRGGVAVSAMLGGLQGEGAGKPPQASLTSPLRPQVSDRSAASAPSDASGRIRLVRQLRSVNKSGRASALTSPRRRARREVATKPLSGRPLVALGRAIPRSLCLPREPMPTTVHPRKFSPKAARAVTHHQAP